MIHRFDDVASCKLWDKQPATSLLRHSWWAEDIAGLRFLSFPSPISREEAQAISGLSVVGAALDPRDLPPKPRIVLAEKGTPPPRGWGMPKRRSQQNFPEDLEK